MSPMTHSITRCYTSMWSILFRAVEGIMKFTMVLAILMSLSVLSASFVIAEDENNVSGISHGLSERGLFLPSWLWITATGVDDNNNHRIVREVMRLSHRRRHRIKGEHNPPSGYFVRRSWPGLSRNSDWRKRSGYTVRYKCPFKNFRLPEMVEQHSMECDNIFEDGK